MHQPPAEETQGLYERKAFNEHYGGYPEMYYLITNGDLSKYKEVDKWKTDDFFFWAEYLLRKRLVENIK
ncbi:hypothetical protein ACFFLS_06055 [Flavobacterium procerum]|uniref:Uncharacterized protein n=1 Tax=Flavobacterium procerum TaxID=1455569 RepID=A0ABV6BPQ4_9FLAO